MRDRASRRFLTVLMLIAIGLVGLVIGPFATAFFMAAVLAGVLHRHQVRFATSLGGRPYLAAGLLTAGIVLLLVLPFAVLSVVVVKEAAELQQWISRTAREQGIEGLVAPLPEPLRSPARSALRFVPPDLLGLDLSAESLPADAPVRGEELEGPPPRAVEQAPDGAADQTDPSMDPARAARAIRPHLGRAAGVVGKVLGGLTGFLLFLGLFVIATFFLLAEGAKLVDYLVDLVPLGARDTRRMLDSFREITEAVLLSTIATAAVQTLVALAGYLIAGVRPLALLVFVTFLMAFVPAIGATGVVAATGVVLWISGKVGLGIFLLIWGLVAVGLTDNVVKPLLVRGRVTLPSSVVFFAMICGLAVFGPIGIVAGPLSVTFFVAVAEMLRGGKATASS